MSSQPSPSSSSVPSALPLPLIQSHPLKFFILLMASTEWTSSLGIGEFQIFLVIWNHKVTNTLRKVIDKLDRFLRNQIPGTKQVIDAMNLEHSTSQQSPLAFLNNHDCDLILKSKNNLEVSYETNRGGIPRNIQQNVIPINHKNVPISLVGMQKYLKKECKV